MHTLNEINNNNLHMTTTMLMTMTTMERARSLYETMPGPRFAEMWNVDGNRRVTYERNDV